MWNRLRGLALLILFSFLLPWPVQAQQAARAAIGAPELDAFPLIEIYLDVHDAQGRFVHGLQADQVLVLENGNGIPASAIEEIRPGVQVVVAINPGPSFGVRNSRGISRYDYLKTDLSNWARSRIGSTLDDWSLIITNGQEVSHISDPNQWLAALEKDETNARDAEPNLDSLFRAVTLAADPSERSGMGRAVLYITPPLEGQLNQPLDNLISQAKQQAVSIFIWAIVPAGAPSSTTGMKNLINLAEQTGGQILTYSGEETLPNPEEYLAPLRLIYRLAYQSSITAGGQQQLAVRIHDDPATIESTPRTFGIDLQPPKPAFISPPIEIKRTLVTPAPSQGTAEPASAELPAAEPAEAELLPTEHGLQVVFDFPDGRSRPLAQTALYVDGALVDKNLEPPFDQFSWALDSYQANGTHILQVQVTDTLGLTGSSIDLPVFVLVDTPQKNTWLTLQRSLPLLTVLLVIVAGAILLLVLLVGGRLRPATQRVPRSQTRKSDPLTQPVAIQEDASHQQQGWANRLHWPQRHIAPKAHAFLSRISDSDTLSTAPPTPITTYEVTLGSNSSLSTLVLDDPSVEGLHARLLRLEDGSFRLSDEGSVAGTWVNYSPVSKSGTQLVHGDLVHIGRVGFRFTLRQPTQVRKPVIFPDTLQSATAKPRPNQEPPP